MRTYPEKLLLEEGARNSSSYGPLLAALYYSLRDEGLGRVEGALLTAMMYALDGILGPIDVRHDKGEQVVKSASRNSYLYPEDDLS